MSTPYSGVASTVSNSLSRTVNGATNATPIVISTTASHLFSTGDVVSVSGVTGNTAANGSWTIIVIDATHFSLTTSVGSGAYVSGGTAIDTSLTPAFQIPSDGDVFNAAAWNVPIEALADRTQFLAQKILGAGTRVVTYTSNGTHTTGVRAPVFLIGACGGGGGGGGATSSTGANISGMSGGGGGGAAFTWQLVLGTANTAYPVVIGTGGIGPGSSQNGVDGASSSFGTTLAVYPGAQGGRTSTVQAFAGTSVCLGGTSIAQASSVYNASTANQLDPSSLSAGPGVQESGYGGFGVAAGVAGKQGATNRYGSFVGGTGGAAGAVVGGTNGGGGGGGGGGGPFGFGAVGGAGGAGNNAGAGGTGSTPSAAAANTGAGGGGGGCGGVGSTTSGTGGAGSSGGSGQMIVIEFYLQ